jgi:hypothetical protein
LVLPASWALLTTPPGSTCSGPAGCTPCTPPTPLAASGPPTGSAGPAGQTPGPQGAAPTTTRGTRRCRRRRGCRRRSRGDERGRAAGEELEDRVGGQGVVVVLVLVTGQDAEDTGADHFREGVLGQLRIAGVVQRRGELSGQPDAFVELPQRQQAGVGGERGVGHLDLDGQRLEKANANNAADAAHTGAFPRLARRSSGTTVETNTGPVAVSGHADCRRRRPWGRQRGVVPATT